MKRIATIVALFFLSLAGACSEGDPTYPEDLLETAEPPELPAFQPDAGGLWGEPEAGPVDLRWQAPSCTTGEDCPTGICLPAAQGSRCALDCEDGCPPGTSCRALEAGGPDSLFLCLPDQVPFCRPCRVDGDCQRYPGDLGAFCEENGPEGSFCTTWCDDGADCPVGHSCTEAGICRSAGPCDCTALPGNQGYVTDCLITNELGSCPGERKCTAEGLTPCTGQVPEAESCDNLDNNCNGVVDEGLGKAPCPLQNVYGLCGGTEACVDGQIVCAGTAPAAESCNGIDDDCDGEVDEQGASGCQTFHPDGDGDGFGSGAGICLCGAAGAGYVANGLDCADGDVAIHPAAPELCDGLDNNCSGVVDEGCDLDLDGYCNQAPVLWGPQLVCQHQELDCDDLDAAVHPGAPELCDGLDNDCDVLPDEGCDQDGDGYCSPAPIAFGPGQVCQHPEADCRDDLAEVNPGATDTCNARDDNCNGVKDEECDGDGDGYCAGPGPEEMLDGCAQLPGIMQEACVYDFYANACPLGFGDCDDQDPLRAPNQGELCNGVDDDCDGTVDEDLDGDGDGFCAGLLPPGDGCLACPLGAGDCDDEDSDVHPAALDLPDALALDANCDGMDGDLATCVFVDGESGQDYWSGTPAKPKRSIQAGLTEAAAAPGPACVVVALGTYAEESLEIPAGSHLWGGYSPTTWAAVPGVRSTLEGGPVAVRFEGPGAPASLGRFVVSAAPATLPGHSSIAVRAQSLAHLVVGDAVLVAGAGKAGAPGSNGAPGLPGSAGTDGSKGCIPNPLCGGSGSCQLFASGGEGAAGVSCGGYGQGKAVLKPVGWNPAWYEILGWSGAEAGEPSCCYRLYGPSAGGAPGSKGAESAGDGTSGQDGVSGSAGSGGAGGQSIWTLGQSGLVGQEGGWGGNGTHGCGGGGGGKGDNYDSWWECEELGGGGGGGGAGGSGGYGGHGGQPGGSSVALLLVDTPATVQNAILQAANGGAGGKGGTGGAGGLGGYGGQGGSGLSHSGDGGHGGHGGNGGQGGGGGGGAGGLSLALARSCGVFAAIVGSELTAGAPGAGGAGGLSAPAGKGINGQPGLAAPSKCFTAVP